MQSGRASLFISLLLASGVVGCTAQIGDAPNGTAPPTSIAPPKGSVSDDRRSIGELGEEVPLPEDPGEGAGDDPIQQDPTQEPPPPPPPSKLASELLADEAARELKAMVSSTYSHTTFVDESKGVFQYDCSGFLGYALSKSTPDALDTVKSFGAVARPLAKHFELFFASIPSGAKKGRWSRVPRALDLVPGDVVAWLTPADLVTSNTGHVMIVRAAPTKNPKRSDEILVPITDSTSSPHGPTDSRTKASADGLGIGPIGLIVNAKGEPTGYRWTGAYSTKEYVTAVSLGHLN